MTVSASKRHISHLEYLHQATKTITQSYKIYRKLDQHWKNTVGKHMLDLAYEIETNVHRANTIYVTYVTEEKIRLKYEAIIIHDE